jgi:hypothetical protein
MNWQAILRNQWFQLCLAAAICSAGAGIFDLATGSSRNPFPTPSPSPSPPPYVTPPLVPLIAKQVGHWIVDASGGDSDSRDLAQVVASASNGDTVTIRPGRYEAMLVINKDLTFVGKGSSPAETLIFFNQDQSNVIDVEAGHVTFSNLQIEQDFNTTFAALYSGKQAHVELTNCSVTSRSTYDVSVGADVQLDARDSAFSSSDIGYGVVFQERAHGTLTRCNIMNNKFGLQVQNQARAQVDDCTFQYNGDRNGYGNVGGVNGSGATLDFTRSNFLKNSVPVYAYESGSLSMTGCTLENNGISLEAQHVANGLILVQTGAQATLTNLVCKFNKQGIAVMTAGKAQLNNVILSNTGIGAGDANFFNNSIYLDGDGTSASVSKSSISDGVYTGILVVNGAKVLLENSSISNSNLSGLVFGSEDGTPGYGTLSNSTVLGNHVAGIIVQSKSSIEVNGGEISNNLLNGVEVAGTGSAVAVNYTSVRNHPDVGLYAYRGGTITARHCLIEKNRTGIQAGIADTGRASAGTILLESSTVQNNIGYGAISCSGSVINFNANNFKNGRYDYLEQSGGVIRGK